MDGQDHSDLDAGPLDNHHGSQAAPSLPAEIECDIFTIAYHQDRENVMNLLTVSKRISKWIISLIYEVVAFSGSPPMKHPPLENLQRYGHHVKHLLLSLNFKKFPPPIDEGAILRSCPNISDLVLGIGCTSSVALFDLPLKRLALLEHETTRFEDQIEYLRQTNDEKYRRWSSNITHIAWESLSLSSCQTTLAPAFLNLTHFLIGYWNVYLLQKGIVDYMVESFRALEVLVVLLETPGAEIIGLEEVDSLLEQDRAQELSEAEIIMEPGVIYSLFGVEFEDPRVVMIKSRFVTNWVEGARGGDGLWAVAEQAVKERRRRVSGLL
ncbi:hypothetical protein BDN72DRAFT_956035 [Pluteus cervinus]|uniref:Uncharacterized protein n=1 Tax=Pluteus cervinus TaxID=181527 RepID=A0ACD3B7X7_9AGAR|nr:hypothetical protein BDN72DRAFT_956035 [Pluteus cervinus]